MCSHFEAVNKVERLKQFFEVESPIESYKTDIWPHYQSVFIRKHEFSDVGDEAVPSHEALTGAFGMIAPWTKDNTKKYATFNARSETVAQKPTFKDAWNKARHCIIPVEAFYEPDWRSGKAIASRFENSDGSPMGIAGLWSRWKSAEGEIQFSFTMLTINADQHPLLKNYHKPGDEKRMVVVLPPCSYERWLNATVDQSNSFLQPYEANLLKVT